MLKLYLAVSRPRFWLYLLGPYLIGVAAAGPVINTTLLVLLGLFFTWPANLLIYGVNDLFDYDTDRHNPKKKGYEKLLTPKARERLVLPISLAAGLGLGLVIWGVPPVVRWGMAGFYFFGLFYSMPPIRAKTKPFFDSLFNVLYVFPGIIGYGAVTGLLPPPQIIAAAWLWCVAMHAFSAVPDINADSRAGINTIATRLGARLSVLFCLVCYLLAAILAYPWIGWFSVLAAGVYAGLMAASLSDLSRSHLFAVYRWFPFINIVLGAALYGWIITL
jgi:lycopene elongase/hydratase (dihydrobisanhydrobacterioruberin-forming)